MNHQIFSELEKFYLLTLPEGKKGYIKYCNNTAICDPDTFLDIGSLVHRLSLMDQPSVLIRGIVADVAHFIVYDIAISNNWLEVPIAKALADYLNLPFVKYEERTPKDLPEIVGQSTNFALRPIRELIDEKDERIIYEQVSDNYVLTKPSQEFLDGRKFREIVDSIPVATNYQYEKTEDKKETQ